jgi:argininosuccinate lyase
MQRPFHRIHGPSVGLFWFGADHTHMHSMHEFNQSLKYDKRMYAADVKGSIAFSKALLKAGIVSESEQKELERGLKQVEQEWKDGKVSSRVA